MKKPPLTTRQINKAIKLYLSGMTIKDITKEIKASGNWYVQFRERSSTKALMALRKKRKSRKTLILGKIIDKAIRLFKSGKPFPEISKKLNCPYGLLYSGIRERLSIKEYERIKKEVFEKKRADFLRRIRGCANDIVVARKMGMTRQNISLIRKKYGIPVKIKMKKDDEIKGIKINRYKKIWINGISYGVLAKIIGCSRGAVTQKFRLHMSPEDREKREQAIIKATRKKWRKKILMHLHSCKTRKELAAKMGCTYSNLWFIARKHGLRPMMKRHINRQKLILNQ